MKKTFILLPLAGLICYFLMTSNSAGPGISGNGDRTGATSFSAGCGGIGCHSAGPTPTTSISIQLYDATGTTLITPAAYVPGTSYKIRLKGANSSTTVTNLTKFGFQLSVVSSVSTSTNEGTLAAPTGTYHLGSYGGINIVEHSSALAGVGSGGPGTTYTVPDIPWTAPATGVGQVTVYAVLNAVNANTSADVNDLWIKDILQIDEATSTTVAPITGTLSVCKTLTTALSDATAGGTWSSGNTSVATVTAGGVVAGVAVGTATITYNAGASGNATAVVTVITTPSPAAVTGASLVCVGTHIYLSDATPGGIWSSSATTMATAGTAGMIVGVAVGSSTISYTVTNSCGTATVTHTVAVHAFGGTCVSGVNNTVPTGTELKVYPNPNSGVFTINLQSDYSADAHVTITNMVGATVKEFNVATNKAVDVQMDRPAGIYFLSAKTANGVYVSRVVVEN